MSNSNHELFNDPLPDDVLDHLDDAEMRNKWPQACTDIIAVLEACYLRAGEDDTHARKLAVAAMLALGEYAGGSILYLPKSDAIRRLLRNRQIWEQFDGNNVRGLARQYKLTEPHIYEIIREQRTLHARRVQPELPLTRTL